MLSNIDDLNNKIIAENNLVVQQANKILEQNKTLAQNTASVESNNTIVKTNTVSIPKSTTKTTKPVQQKPKDTTTPKKKTKTKAKTSSGKQTYFAYSGSVKAPLGFQIGRTNNDHGYYVGMRLSFKNSTNASYDCNNTSVLNYNESGYYIFDDKMQNQRFSFTVGYIRQMSSKINVYAGIGYGYSNLLWHIDQYQYPNNKYSDTWIKNTNYSTKGFESEIGIVTRISDLINLNTGFSFLNFKKMNWTFGLGFNL
jgi:opacity protein-like surface antigen